jgi:predicted nucleotidyltransferase
MHSLYKISSGEMETREVLEKSEKLSVFYHDLFDFPLTFADLIRWKPSKYLSLKQRSISVIYQDGYYFLNNRRGLIYKRSLRERISSKKLEIAKKASNILSLIPAVLMVAVTGSLAMENAGDESDIDLFIITGRNTLWMTRMLSYLILKVFGFDLRKSGDKNQKDKLCLNMWIDETDLVWRSNDRNLYTAHEIAQILPLVNKNKTYEKFLYKNKWILKYWPNSIKIGKYQESSKTLVFSNPTFSLIENIAFRIQFGFMKSKITREVATPTRAIFHPQNLGKLVISRLAS